VIDGEQTLLTCCVDKNSNEHQLLLTPVKLLYFQLFPVLCVYCKLPAPQVICIV